MSVMWQQNAKGASLIDRFYYVRETRGGEPGRSQRSGMLAGVLMSTGSALFSSLASAHPVAEVDVVVASRRTKCNVYGQGRDGTSARVLEEMNQRRKTMADAMAHTPQGPMSDVGCVRLREYGSCMSCFMYFRFLH